MVGFSVVCVYCGDSAPVIRFGKTESGSLRYRCRSCARTFTAVPKSRALTPEKEEQIVGLLAERTSQRGIARALKVSRDTVRAVRKKRQPE